MKKKKNVFVRILKWTGILFLLLLLFLIAAPFLFKDKIMEIAKEEAGKHLAAKLEFGEFDMTIFSSFPDLTLTVNDVSLANLEPFAGDTLFRTKQMSVTLNLMSVIMGDSYKIRKVLLDEPVVKATVLEDGRASYDIARTAPDTAAVAAPDTGAPAKFNMSLKSLEIRNARILYDDRAGNMKAVLDSFSFFLSGDFSLDNFEMKNETSIGALSFYMDGIPWLMKVRTSAKASLDADMSAMKFTMKENEFNVNELGFGLTGWFAMPGQDYDMDLAFECRQSEFKSFLSLIPGMYTKEFAGVKTSGSLAFKGNAKGIYNEKRLPAFDLKLKVDKASFQYPGLPGSANNIFIDLSVANASGEMDATVTDLNRFHAELSGNPVDIVMHVSNPISDPSIRGQVLGKVDLTALKDVVPLEKGDELSGKVEADVKLNGRYSSIEQQKYEEFEATGQVKVMDMKYSSAGLPAMDISGMVLGFSPQFVSLSDFKAAMGKSDFRADGRIENFMQYLFKDSLLKGNFSLGSQLTDLNEFMNGNEDASSTTATDTTGSSLSVIEVPGNIDFVLNSQFAQLNYDQLQLKNVKGEVVLRDRKVWLRDLAMNAMGGSMKMNGSYSTENPLAPKVDMSLNIRDFDIQQTAKYFSMVEKLAPVAKYASGKFSTDITYSSLLDSSMMPIPATLQGSGRLKTSKVTVSNFEPLNKLADALGGFDKFRKAEFSDLDVAYSFKDGKVTYDKFPFKAGSLSGDVEGTTGFDRAIQYIMAFEVPTKDMPKSMQDKVSGLLSGAGMLGLNAKMPEKVKLNALIGGTVSDPVVKTDVKEIAGSVVETVTETIKDTLKKVVEEKIQEVKKDLTAEKEKIMKDAEETAKKIREEAARSAEQVRTEGNKKADELEKAAKNPLEKVAAKKAADKMRKETEEKCNKIIEEGNKKADKVMEDAKVKADALK